MAISTTGLIPNWFPPNRENYDLIVSIWKWMPVVSTYLDRHPINQPT